MRLVPRVLLTSGLASLAAAQVLSSTGGGFSYAPCTPSLATLNTTRLARGDRTHLCLHMGGNATALFTPKVDDFEGISIIGSNYALPSNSKYLLQGTGVVENFTIPSSADVNCSLYQTQHLYATFDVSVLGLTTPFPRVYKHIKVNPCLYAVPDVDTYPIYTVVVGLDQGVINYVAWDDGCFFCASNGPSCHNTAVNASTGIPVDDASMRGCTTTADTCYPTTSVGSNVTNSSLPTTPCDLKLFVVWIGTDANGSYLTSAGKRFSQFRSYGTNTLVQSALNLADTGMNVARSAIDYAEGIPGRVVPGDRSLHEVADSSDATYVVKPSAAQHGSGLLRMH